MKFKSIKKKKGKNIFSKMGSSRKNEMVCANRSHRPISMGKKVRKKVLHLFENKKIKKVLDFLSIHVNESVILSMDSKRGQVFFVIFLQKRNEKKGADA